MNIYQKIQVLIFGDGQIVYNYKELHICKVQEDGTSVMFTIQTK